MHKKLFLIILIICIFITFLFLKSGNVKEDVYDFDTFSGDTIFENSNSYDIFVNDDTITYYDENGNSIIYLFQADRLSNVYSVYVAENEVQASRIADYFLLQVGNGEIAEVTQKENSVFVSMDMNFFEEYENYTKKQIEEILLKDAKIVEEE